MLGKEILLSFFIFLRMKPDALDAFDGGIRQVTGPNATAGVFATYPKPFVTTANGFADQVTICSRVPRASPRSATGFYVAVGLFGNSSRKASKFGKNISR